MSISKYNTRLSMVYGNLTLETATSKDKEAKTSSSDIHLLKVLLEISGLWAEEFI